MPYFSSSFDKKVNRKIDYVLNLFDKHSPQKQCLKNLTDQH